MHLTRQAVVVSTRKRKKSNKPVRIAPIILVAAKVTAKRRMARNIVPKIAISRVLSAEQTHLLSAP